jgi:hypothetical protein
MTNKIYQIKIALQRSKPGIWRRILVSPDTPLSSLHGIIQITMGWENAHLHQFIKGSTYYTQRMEDDGFWDDADNVDYKGMKTSDLLKKEKDKIVYEYDFGDSWYHDIILEKILPADNKMHYPVCIKGKMNCPPEDCGGIWGYEGMLEVLKNPDNEEYEDYIEWLGEEFDPEYFDEKEVNILLKRHF